MRLKQAGWFFFAVLVILGATLLLLPVSRPAAANYSTAMIWEYNGNSSGFIQMNNYGYMLIREDWGNSLSLWRGGAKNAIPGTDDSSGSFDLNDVNQVVWRQYYVLSPSIHYDDVYLYSGGATAKLTNAEVDHINHSGPRINNQGTIIWNEWLGDHFRMVRRSAEGGLSYSDNFYTLGSPKINDRDEVVWSGTLTSVDPYAQIFYWHGATLETITSDAASNVQPLINNRGDIVYAKFIATDSYDLYLYNGSSHTHTKIGSSASDNLLYQLNDQGQVSWISNNGRLYLYSGASNTFIAPTDYYNGYRQLGYLNNHGQVVYQSSDCKLKLYDHRYGTTTTLVNTWVLRGLTPINDPGQVVWVQSATYPNKYLYLANPISSTPPVNLLLLND
jgi:hypothetical protein